MRPPQKNTLQPLPNSGKKGPTHQKCRIWKSVSAGTLKVLRNSSSVINHSCNHSGADAADSGARTADPRMLGFTRTQSDWKRAPEVKVCFGGLQNRQHSFGAWPGALQPSQEVSLTVVLTFGIDLICGSGKSGILHQDLGRIFGN